MAGKSLELKIEINFFTILGMVMFLHVCSFIVLHGPGEIFQHLQELSQERNPLNIHSIRKIGAKDAKSLNSSYLNFSDSKSPQIGTGPKSAQLVPSAKQDISLRDLTMDPVGSQSMPRPGTRPEVGQKPRAIEAISLKGKEIKKFIQGSNAMALSGDDRKDGMANSDVMVKLEVPEGVDPDELNEYELMFYSFQRRTAINYINSFYNNLNAFERENPHVKFPMTEAKQVMTGRLTYDEKGNIKQIKMIRWTNVDKLQSFFEEVLKDMDTLHNPPKALWAKNGEFSIFFSLVINGQL